MSGKARSHNGIWICPRCGIRNSADGLCKPPGTVSITCHDCINRTEVFIPLEIITPFDSDGIMYDQVYARLENSKWWNFMCPACSQKNIETHASKNQRRNILEKEPFDVTVKCAHCNRSIRITGEE